MERWEMRRQGWRVPVGEWFRRRRWSCPRRCRPRFQTSAFEPVLISLKRNWGPDENVHKYDKQRQLKSFQYWCLHDFLKLRDITSGNGWVAKDIECFVVLFSSRCLQKRSFHRNIFSNHESLITYQSRIKITWEAHCWYEVVREVSRAVGQSCTRRSAEYSQKEPEIPNWKLSK